MAELAIIGIAVAFVVAIWYAQRGGGRADDEPGVYGGANQTAGWGGGDGGGGGGGGGGAGG